MTTIWTPTERQAVAMSCPALELLYGGAKGGGKTDWLVAEWLSLLELAAQKRLKTGIRQAKCRIGVFRKNMEDLKDFIAKSLALYPAFDPQAQWNQHEKTWTFGSGAAISLRHLDGPNDHLGYSGNEFAGLGFDEVQQIEFAAYSFLFQQLRSGDPEYHARRKVRCTCNFDGYDWIVPHFGLDKHPEGGVILRQTVEARGFKYETTRAFVRARLRDNKHLDPSYEAQLRSFMNDDEIAIYLDGDHRRAPGAFFSRLIRPTLHFQRSRAMPDDLEWRFALDWGSSAPASLHIGGVDREGTLWVVDELWGPGVTGSQFGERMARLWKTSSWTYPKRFKVDDFYGVIDKQAFDDAGGAATAGAGIMQHGFRIFHAQKDRMAGCNQMMERLVLRPDGTPKMVIFEDRCPRLVSALSKIKSDAPFHPNEYTPKSEFSHACDSLRFLAMEFPIMTARESRPHDDMLRRWEALSRHREQQIEQQDGMVSGYGN